MSCCQAYTYYTRLASIPWGSTRRCMPFPLHEFGWHELYLEKQKHHIFILTAFNAGKFYSESHQRGNIYAVRKMIGRKPWHKFTQCFSLCVNKLMQCFAYQTSQSHDLRQICFPLINQSWAYFFWRVSSQPINQSCACAACAQKLHPMRLHYVEGKIKLCTKGKSPVLCHK